MPSTVPAGAQDEQSTDPSAPGTETPPDLVRAPTDAPAPDAAPPRAAPPAREREPALAEYSRADWPHWIDADGDCQDTRTEVLLAEAEPGSVVFTDAKKCKIATGRWLCPYTGRAVVDPHELDVDHLVPLAHAHAAGGKRWSKAQRTAFANELGDPRHLVAVIAASNRSKGARSIVTWLPPDARARCEYVEAWRAIVSRWSLEETSVEAETARAYAAECREGRTPALAHEETLPPRADTVETRTCCKVCSAGKPCGDGCIARDKACHKPPGCAC
jgi:hypothetical protein